MKKFLKRGALFLSAMLLATGMAACSGTNTDGTNTDGAAKDSITIGISQLVEHDALDASRNGFLDRLKEIGYVEGENLVIEYQNAQGEQANAQTIAENFATNSNLDLILAIATNAAIPLANIIDNVPILVTAVTDPEDAGLVTSNENPGGNVTGTSDLNPITEQVDLLTRLVPDVETVAIIYNSSEQNSVLQGEHVIAALAEKDIEGVLYTTPSSTDLQTVLQSSIGKVDAWYIPTDNLLADNMATVQGIATENNIPVIAGEINMMNNGALATVSVDYYELGRLTADMAIEILEDDADPATMAIRYQENPTLHVNKEFAEAIGLEIPQDILDEAEADE